MNKLHLTHQDSQGHPLELLAFYNNYAIIKRQTEYTPYIVAYAPEFEGQHLSWGQGHYIDTLEQAQELFLEKTTDKNTFILDAVKQKYNAIISKAWETGKMLGIENACKTDKLWFTVQQIEEWLKELKEAKP